MTATWTMCGCSSCVVGASAAELLESAGPGLSGLFGRITSK